MIPSVTHLAVAGGGEAGFQGLEFGEQFGAEGGLVFGRGIRSFAKGIFRLAAGDPPAKLRA